MVRQHVQRHLQGATHLHHSAAGGGGGGPKGRARAGRQMQSEILPHLRGQELTNVRVRVTHPVFLLRPSDLVIQLGRTANNTKVNASSRKHVFLRGRIKGWGGGGGGGKGWAGEVSGKAHGE